MAERPKGQPRSGMLGTLLFLLAIVAVLGLLRARMGGVAPTPDVFQTELTLDAALAQSGQTGKPVLVMATADWCGPCQVLKRGALTNSDVAAWIEQNAIAVYADFTDDSTPEAQQALAALRIEAYPTLLLLREGEELGRRTGVLPAEDLLAWFGSIEPTSS